MLLRRFAIFCAVLCAAVLPLAGRSQSKQSGAETKKVAASSKSGAATIKSGKAAFNTYCAICHLANSTEKKIGPGLKGLGKREKFAAGDKITDESLRAWIEKGGKDMPGFKETLTQDQIRDIIAYVKTL